MGQTWIMSVGAALTSWFRRTGSEILGWVLIPVGVLLMPLPGPGLLIVVAGVALLSRRYAWAQKLLDPLERRAIEAAKYGVATWPRIVLSFLGGVWLFALGVVWWVSPEIPEFSIAAFTIPAGVVATAFVIAVVLFSMGAIFVLRELLRTGDGVRSAIVGVAWVLGLWLATTHTPDLSDRPIDLAFGPELPAHGWGTAIGLWSSAIAAWGLLAYSVVRWRGHDQVQQTQH